MLEIQKPKPTDDLFAFWQNELHLRQEFRHSFITGKLLIISNVEQLEFLYRSLYLAGRHEEFFAVLIPNLDKTPALNWLKTAPPKIKEAFLSYLPAYIEDYQPRIEQLFFLVHIYTSEFNNLFIPIVNKLSPSQCQIIINKTANPNFRNLLKKRTSLIEREQKRLFYGLNLTKNILTYPTIQGDKVKLLIETVTLLAATQSNDDYQAYFNLAGALFDLGLIEDSLHLQIQIYKENLHTDSLDETIIRAWQKIIFKTVPLYALLNDASPYDYAQQIYAHHFPQLSNDAVSISYLKLYEKLRVDSSANTVALLALYSEISKIRHMRVEETPLLFDYEINSGISAQRFADISQLAQNKLISLPHEAFVILELLRKLLKHNMISEKVNKDLIAQQYLALFRWLPSSRFMNETIITEIMTNTSPSIREELDKVLKLIIHYKKNSLLAALAEKPDLFKLKNEELRRIILTGKFMGVLR